MNKKKTLSILSGGAVLVAVALTSVQVAAQEDGSEASAPPQFEAVDADGDGGISREEWRAFLGERQMRWHGRSGAAEWLRERMGERHAERADEDAPGPRRFGRTGGRERRGWGGLGWLEMHLGSHDPEDFAERMIERFDADDDGALSAEEIATGIVEMMERHEAMGGRMQERLGSLRQRMQEGRGEMRRHQRDPEARADMMFDRIDTDGDGAISRAEFDAMLERMETARRGMWRRGPSPSDGDDAVAD